MISDMKTTFKFSLLISIFFLNHFCFSQKKRLMVQQGHSSFVETIAFSPDNSKIFTGSVDVTFKIWDSKTGKLLRFAELDNPYDYISGGFFYLKGGQQAIIQTINNIQLWDLENLTHTIVYRNVSSDDKLRGITQDGSKILIINPKRFSSAFVIDIKQKKRILNIRLTSEIFQKATSSRYMHKVNDATFSPNEKMILVGLSNGTTKLIDIKTHKILKTFKKDTVQIKKVGFSNDGLFIYTLNTKNVVTVWNRQTEKIRQQINFPKEYMINNDAIFPSRGLVVLSDQRNNLMIKNMNSGRLIQKFNFKNRTIYNPRVSSDVKTFLCVSNYDFMLWDVETGKQLLLIPTAYKTTIPFQVASDSVHITQITMLGGEISFNENTKVKAVKSERDNDPNIYLRDAKTHKLKATLYSGFPNKKAWLITTPNGKYDGNKEGLQYLHYVKGVDRVLPLPKNDPNRVKGLLKKLLK